MISSWCFRNVWTHLKGIDAVVLKYVGNTLIITHQNITSSYFWRNGSYRCPGRESLLCNEKMQFWIECHNIYQLNICIALQRTNKLGKGVDNLLAPLLLPSRHTPVPKTSSRHVCKTPKTLSQRTSIKPKITRLGDYSLRRPQDNVFKTSER